jgi:hypothetical protein
MNECLTRDNPMCFSIDDPIDLRHDPGKKCNIGDSKAIMEKCKAAADSIGDPRKLQELF